MQQVHQLPRERAIRLLRGRVVRTFFLKYTSQQVVLWLFLWGCVALVLRMTMPISSELLFHGGWGLLPIPFLSYVLARRRAPSDRTASAILDRGNHSGGLLMASLEIDPGNWGAKMDSLQVPRCGWKSRRMVGLAFLGAAFLAVVLAVPQRALVARGQQKLNIRDEVAQLEKQLETLKEEDLLDVERVEKLRQELQRVEQEAEGEGPVKTWDALDHLAQELENEAEAAAEKALSDTEEMSRAEALARGLEKDMNDMSPELAREAMKALGDMVDEALSERESLEKETDGKLSKEQLEKMREAIKNGNLSPEQLQKLADALKNCRGDCQRMMRNLKNAKLLDGQFGEMSDLDKEIDADGLKEFLEECDKQGGDCQKMSELWADRNCPGRGGISRGRGDAPMTWRDKETERGNAEFKEKSLPGATPEAFRDSRMIGVSSGAPDRGATDTDAGQGGALSTEVRGTGTAHSQTVYPRHRGTIRRYFDHQE